ncbi:hypothetical protein K2X14_09480 [Acetobacter sp. TBRC 12305]|uniref:hypothetical protein n=1 Tax=Acetobacter garciniae TaxID=2817435 RepID=UPI001C7303E3|nr:hypothetical protein [Acetobacter garciniae]MBX0345063.1 hypothetical protein [Acetobacter garciniae]
MKRKRTPWPIALVLACLGAAWASPFATRPARADALPPRYDTNGLCFRNANTADGLSPEAVASCIASQGNALNAIRRLWDNIPPDLADDCDRRIRASGAQDYNALENCLKLQMRQNEYIPLVPPTKYQPFHDQDAANPNPATQGQNGP